MKKILFVSHEGSITGAPLFLNRLVKYLKDERSEYKIAIFFSMTGELVELLDKEDINIYISEKFVKSNSRLYKLLKRIKHYLLYMQVLITFRPNLVYSNTILNFSEVFLAKLFNVTVLMHIHEGRNFCSSFRRRLKISCLLANRIVVGSHYVNNVLHSLTKRLGVVVYNGVKLPERIPVKKKQYNMPMKMGVLGTIDSNKGQLVAIEALNLLVAKGVSVTLQVAGKVVDEGYYSTLCNCVKDYKLDDYVKFLGVVPDSIDFLNSLDVLIVPSFDEAFPTVILEAFSTGTLVVASDVGGIPEIVKNYVNGLLVKAGDYNMLAEAIENVVNDKCLLKKLSTLASQDLLDKFDVRVSNHILSAHIDELLLTYKLR